MGVPYCSRQVAEGLTDFQLYDAAFNNGKNVLLEGATGEGKSMSVRTWAKENDLNLYEVNFAFGVDSRHVIGGWYPDERGGFRWEDGLATQAFTDPDGAVLFLDEINRVPPAVSAHLHTVLDTHRSISLVEQDGGSIITPENNVLIVAAMNPESSSYQGAMRLDEALRRRFPYQIKWETDNSVLHDVVKDERVVSMAVALRNSPQAQRFVTPLSTASFVELDEAIVELGEDPAITFFLNRFKDDERPDVVEFVELYLSEDAPEEKPAKRSFRSATPRKRGAQSVRRSRRATV